jgi:hypothetical protein
MITYEDVRELILAFPGTEETISWDGPSLKVNKKVILYGNSQSDSPVFKVPFEVRTSCWRSTRRPFTSRITIALALGWGSLTCSI